MKIKKCKGITEATSVKNSFGYSLVHAVFLIL